MLYSKSISQKFRNTKKSSIIALLLSVFLWLIIIVDKIVLKGAINLYIHTSVTYTVIFFLQFLAFRQEWESIVNTINNLKQKLNKKNILIMVSLASFVLLLILAKDKINEYLIHQNILDVEYSFIRIMLNLQFLAKSIILFAGSILTALLSSFLTRRNKVETARKRSFRGFLPLFIVLVGVFIAIKLFFVFHYSGNFQDDWYHIVAGLNLFKDGTLTKINQYFDGSGYRRGLYMTALTNFFMLIFGKSVDIAELAPAFIGTVNFILLLVLGKKILKNNIYIISFFVLYISNPYVIFNHLYIRFYVFYELFFILIIYLFSWLISSLANKEKRRAIIIGTILLLLNSGIYFLTEDRSAILFPFYTILGFVFCILTQPYLFEYFKNLSQKIFKQKWVLYLTLVIFILFATLAIVKFGLPLFKQIFMTETNSGSNRSSLIHTICYTYAPLVFLSITGLLQAKRYGSRTAMFIGTISAIGLITHIAMPDTYQVIRGFAYLWGPLYLAALLSLERIISLNPLKKFNKPVSIIFFLLFFGSMLLSNIKSYNNNFISTGPNIVGEVAYYQFDDTFKYINEDLGEKTLVESSYNVIPDMFYDLPIKYVLNLNNTLDSAYFPEGTKQVRSIEEFEQLNNKNDVCLVLREFSYYSLLDQNFATYVINHFSMTQTFRGYEIWCERADLE